MSTKKSLKSYQTNNVPRTRIHNIQILREREWEYLMLYVDYFRKLKSQGVKITSKTSVAIQEIFQHKGSRTVMYQKMLTAANVLVHLSILYRYHHLGHERNFKSKLFTRLTRLNDIIRAHKDIGWFKPTPTLIGILKFSLEINTASVKNCIRYIYGEVEDSSFSNHLTKIKKIIASENGILFNCDLPYGVNDRITISLTEKGRKLIGGMIAFTELIDEWGGEELEPPGPQDEMVDYDPMTVNIEGYDFNLNLRSQTRSMRSQITLFLDPTTKRFQIGLISNVDRHSLTRVDLSKLPQFAKNNVNEDFIIGWNYIPIDKIEESYKYRDQVESHFINRGYKLVPVNRRNNGKTNED